VSKKLLSWVGGMLVIVGMAATIVFVAWPNPYQSTIAYLPPPSWHEDGIRVGFSLFGLGILVLVITQFMRSESYQTAPSLSGVPSTRRAGPPPSNPTYR
jgi:hypothetical protein